MSRYVDLAMRSIQGAGRTTKTTLTTKGGVEGGLCRLDRLCRTASSELLPQRICAQCNGGPSTDPPSDAPTVELTRDGLSAYLHPECTRFWKPTKVV
jgi:hypothetical protein